MSKIDTKQKTKRVYNAGCALAVFTVGMGLFITYMQDGVPGINGFVFGALIVGSWCWVFAGNRG